LTLNNEYTMVEAFSGNKFPVRYGLNIGAGLIELPDHLLMCIHVEHSSIAFLDRDTNGIYDIAAIVDIDREADNVRLRLGSPGIALIRVDSGSEITNQFDSIKYVDFLVRAAKQHL